VKVSVFSTTKLLVFVYNLVSLICSFLYKFLKQLYIYTLYINNNIFVLLTYMFICVFFVFVLFFYMFSNLDGFMLINYKLYLC